jgi:hypothetical protein
MKSCGDAETVYDDQDARAIPHAHPSRRLKREDLAMRRPPCNEARRIKWDLAGMVARFPRR